MQGKRVALESQPPHQADNHRHNSDAASEKAAVQQLTAIAGVSPPPPAQQQQQQAPQQRQRQQEDASDAPPPPPPPPRRPSSRQLALAAVLTEPAAPNSVGSQHAKVSSSRSRSPGDDHVTGEDVADSAAARGARGAISVTPSRGNSRHPRCKAAQNFGNGDCISLTFRWFRYVLCPPGTHVATSLEQVETTNRNVQSQAW